MDVARIMVCIPTYNRRAVAEQCIPTVSRGMDRPNDRLFLYDDGSTEYDSMDVGHDFYIRTESMGVDAQRRRHFLDFLDHAHQPFRGAGPSFTHLYLTDADAPHDPAWREHALALYAEHKAPICLYRTQTHADYHGNVYRDRDGENVIWQRFAPGVSYLLDLDMVKKVVAVMPDRISWDWFVPGVLGYKMAVSRTSYCDHIGYRGMHDDSAAVGCVSKERSLNPTPYLIQKRHEILANLGLKDE